MIRFITVTTIIVCMSGILPLSLYGQAGAGKQLWSNFHPNISDGSANLPVEGAGLRMDNAENLYVFYGNTSTIGLSKIDSAGNTVWDQTISPTLSTNFYKIRGLSIDGSGNFYLSGYTHNGNSGLPGLGVWVMKFNASGTKLWENLIPMSMGSTVSAGPVCVNRLDATGNVYVLGRVQAGSPLGPHYWLGQFDNATGALQWAKTAPGYAYEHSMEVNAAGQAAITGSLVSASAYTVVFDSNGANTSPVWEDLNANLFNPVQIKYSGTQVVVSGESDNGVNRDFSIATYNNTGTVVSSVNFDTGVNEYNGVYAIDSQGKIIINTHVTQTSGLPYLDNLLIKAEPNGTIIWTDRYNETPDLDEGLSHMVVDASDNIYISGWAGPTYMVGSSPSNSNMTIKYNGVTGAREMVQMDRAKAGFTVGLAVAGNHAYVLGTTKRKLVKYSMTPETGITTDMFAFLKGPYGTPTFYRFMRRNLNAILPLSQPYQSAPWNYSGTESITQIAPSAVDWVLVEARTGLGGATILGRKAGFIHNDGLVTDHRGAPLTFPAVAPGAGVYFVLYHRNHAPMITASPIVPDEGRYRCDFTATFSGLGGLMGGVAVNSGVWAEYSGDADGNGDVNADDLNLYWLPQNGTSGYLEGDFNMDGTVNLTDRNIFWKPFNGRLSQVPQ